MNTSNGPQKAHAARRPGPAATSAGASPAAAPDAAEILRSVGEALYAWDIKSDGLVWSANAAEVLLARDTAVIASGRAYAQFIGAGDAQARFDAIMQSE